MIVAVLYLLAARSSDPADFGIVVAAIAAGNFAAAITDFGTNAFWLRQLARFPRLAPQFWSVTVSKSLIAILCGIAGFVVLMMMENLFAITAAVGTLLVISQSLSVLPKSMQKQLFVGLQTVTDKSFSLVAYLVFVYLLVLPSYVSLALAVCAGLLVNCVLGLGFTARNLKWNTRKVRMVLPWKGARNFGLATLALSAQSLDSVVLVGVSGASASGAYSAVSRWTQPMGILAGAYTSAIVPHIARHPKIIDSWPTIVRSLWLLGVAIMACFLVFVSSDWIVITFLGEAYSDSTVVLRILAVATAFGILSQPLFAILQVLRFAREVALVTILAVSLQLISIFPLAMISGAVAGAYASLLSQIVMVGSFAWLIILAWKRESKFLTSGVLQN